jgi:hypothetical protein
VRGWVERWPDEWDKNYSIRLSVASQVRVADRMSCAGGLNDGQTNGIKIIIPFVCLSQVRVAGRMSCAGGLNDGQTKNHARVTMPTMPIKQSSVTLTEYLSRERWPPLHPPAAALHAYFMT